MPEAQMHAEWIEMKKDHNERKRAGVPCDRVLLYVHGGAYYFGSVDEHRYQMQRHARKLKARVLAPRYRLAPQFPFPCGLQDCIATYFYLLEHFQPGQILFAGDSAGGGMVLSMLVTLRDQGCPLPAGTILLSPWVDLAHSFPSVAGEGLGDYIPPHGFHHKPSMAWPPPPLNEEEQRKKKAKAYTKKFTQPVEQPFDVVELPATYEDGARPSTKASRDDLRAQANLVSARSSSRNMRAEAAAQAEAQKPAIPLNQIPGMGPRLEIQIDDKLVVIREQFQMYAPNSLLTHPLVSPVQQPSLGGLPPMLIQVGGAELLRDEQIYLAHKAANPRAFPPGEAIINEYDPQRTVLNLYPPTDVQLQVWEDLCHVPHTLSFTRPAKYMYRSVAQFGAWALARAQHKSIDILEDDAVSVISDGEDPDESKYQGGEESYGTIGTEAVSSEQFQLNPVGSVGKAGDELPPFKDHMIRQRVNRHGVIYPLARVADIASLQLDPNSVGAIKTGPVRKWLAKRVENDQKFASDLKKLQKKKLKEVKTYDEPEAGEDPPPTALVNRRKAGVAPEPKKRGKSWGLAMWSGWGSSHDESTIQREDKMNDEREKHGEERPFSRSTMMHPEGTAENTPENTPDTPRRTLAVPGQEPDTDGKSRRRRSSASMLSSPWSTKRRNDSRPRSPYRQVKDEGQASEKDLTPVSPPETPVATSSSRGFWDVSRRSSAASGLTAPGARPSSTATILSSNMKQPSRNHGAPPNGDLEVSADAIS
jgi:acetyl esterase/lipase